MSGTKAEGAYMNYDGGLHDNALIRLLNLHAHHTFRGASSSYNN
jgi:hypothetical protein